MGRWNGLGAIEMYATSSDWVSFSLSKVHTITAKACEITVAIYTSQNGNTNRRVITHWTSDATEMLENGCT